MTKRSNRTISLQSSAGGARSERRGVALLLVVVAMGAAAVLTTAFVLSRDNSAAIGANAHNTAASEWTARSGADLGLAILQTDADWIGAEPAKLLEGFPIAGGVVSVALTDLEGRAPDGEERELAMTVVADSNGVKTVFQRIVSMNPHAEIAEAADPEYGEFGVFATGEIAVEHGSKIAPWPSSPAFKAGAPVKMSAGFTNSAALQLDADASVTSTALYVRPDSSVSLQTMVDDGHFSGGGVLQMVLPAIPPRLPAAMASGLPVQMNTPLVIGSSAQSQTLAGGAYQNLEASNAGSVVTLDDASGAMYSFDAIRLRDGAAIRISGDVGVHVSGDLRIEEGATFELADDASSLRLYLGGGFELDNAGFGVPSEVAMKPMRDIRDLDSYTNPGMLKVYLLGALDGGDGAATVDVRGHSLAVMNAIAPANNVTVQETSTVVGRLTGERVCVRDDSLLCYDPMLDNNMGFTSFDGPFYQNDGSPISGLTDALASYNTALGFDGFTAHLEANSVPVVEAVDIAMPGEPTPRSDRRAAEKPWPFIAMSIEMGNWVTGDHGERQEGLYVPLDDSIFDLDQFYGDGLIVATYGDSDDLIDGVEDVIDDALGGVGDALDGLLSP